MAMNILKVQNVRVRLIATGTKQATRFWDLPHRAVLVFGYDTKVNEFFAQPLDDIDIEVASAGPVTVHGIAYYDLITEELAYGVDFDREQVITDPEDSLNIHATGLGYWFPEIPEMVRRDYPIEDGLLVS